MKNTFAERFVRVWEATAARHEAKRRTRDSLAHMRLAKASNQKLLRKMQTDLAALGVEMTIREETNDD